MSSIELIALVAITAAVAAIVYATVRPADVARGRVRKRRAGLALAAAPVVLIALAGCSSSSDSSDTPASTSPSSSTGSAECTADSLLAALPGGATMVKYNCANTGGQEWAAVRVNPGNTVFFLQWNGGAWDAETSDSVCGTASAGMPAQLLAYCKG